MSEDVKNVYSKIKAERTAQVISVIYKATFGRLNTLPRRTPPAPRAQNATRLAWAGRRGAGHNPPLAKPGATGCRAPPLALGPPGLEGASGGFSGSPPQHSELPWCPAQVFPSNGSYFPSAPSAAFVDAAAVTELSHVCPENQACSQRNNGWERRWLYSTKDSDLAYTAVAEEFNDMLKHSFSAFAATSQLPTGFRCLTCLGASEKSH